MKPQTADSRSTTNFARCSHRTANGRCRMPAVDPAGAFCLDHARLAQEVRQSADVAALLIGHLTEFHSAADINKVLSQLLILLAQDRIAPRRAAVIAYITNQLLRSLREIDRENNPDEDAPVQIILDGPRPIRD